MTVLPQNGGQLVGTSNSALAPQTVFYSVPATSAAQYSFMDSADPNFAFNFINPNIYVSQGSDNRGNLRATNLMVFNVRSDLTTLTVPSTNLGPVLVVQVAPLGYTSSVTSTSFVPGPIAWQNGVDCPGNSNCYQTNAGVSGFNGQTYYYAIPYIAQSTVQVGIYAEDLCLSAKSNTNAGITDPTGLGCNINGGTPGNYGPIVMSAGAPTTMVVQFAITTLTSNSVQGMAVTPPLDFENIALSFQADPPGKVACPAKLSSTYTPSDSSIVVNSDGFGLNANNGATHSNNDAPAQTLLVLGNDSRPLPGSITSPLGFDIAARVPLGGAQIIGGLINATPPAGTDHKYNLAFLVRDSSGLVTAADTNNCSLTNVQTSTILGYLGKSRCFIATAAFKSMDVAPVAMLRLFRDQVLLRTQVGSTFVDWYYAWSPQAALDLLQHPEFQIPVLGALIPVEIFAWILLSPILSGILMLMAIAAILYALFERTRAGVET